MTKAIENSWNYAKMFLRHNFLIKTILFLIFHLFSYYLASINHLQSISSIAMKSFKIFVNQKGIKIISNDRFQSSI